MERSMRTKMKEEIGRKKIAKLLWAMDFHDDDPVATAQIMRQRLRKIEENRKRRSRIKKITFKCGGKRFVKVPLQTPVSEITVACHDNDHMEIDSTCNFSPENHDEVDQSYEEKRLIHMINKNSGNNEDGAMELNNGDDTMETPSNMTIGNENKVDAVMEIKDFIRSVGGSGANLVLQKTLTKSDCDKNQGRLLMPVLQVKNHGFLTTNEKTRLGMRESISVEVFDPQRRKLTLNLAQWKMKNENYVLKTNWTKLVQTNGLKDNMVIQVLSFRVGQKLCFAVVRV